jgi:NMD protein affecting ribosome stability and mRNA decay
MNAETDLGSRRDRLMREHIHDPYKTPHKLPEPTVCPDCGAVFHEGRWQWITPPAASAHRTTCQACHRIHDKYPAGLIMMRGAFVREHAGELLQLVRHQEQAEKTLHPLHRILRIEEMPDAIAIETTDLHLPHRIADALEHAYHGTLKIHYDEEGYFVRVEWQRDT